MKKLLLVVILIVSILCACRAAKMLNNPEAIADNTFEQILEAFKKQDETMLRNLFSEKVHEQTIDFDMQIASLLGFIQGEVISHSTAEEAGVTVNRELEGGKVRTEIQSSFCIGTSTQNYYYIAMMQCTEDTFDRENVGIKSLYVIKAEDWKGESVYRGDAAWLLGINLVEDGGTVLSS